MKKNSSLKHNINSYIKKYYINLAIRGFILFLCFWIITGFSIIYIEHVLWLKSSYRFVMYMILLISFLLLFVYWVLKPILGYLGFARGITKKQAAENIGSFFEGIDDKIVNVLELKEKDGYNEFVEASILQKSKEFENVKFKEAISFREVYKYTYLFIIPFSLVFFIWVSGRAEVLLNSANRLANYKSEYIKPISYRLNVIDSLTVVKGESKEIKVKIKGIGDTSKVYLIYNNREEELILKDDIVVCNFVNVYDDIDFRLMLRGEKSRIKTLVVIDKPSILFLNIKVKPPKYTLISDKNITNTGNVRVPIGSEIEWVLNTENTNSISWISDKESVLMMKKGDIFRYDNKFSENTNYTLSSSNDKLRDYDKLSFSINVILDEFPFIEMNKIEEGNNIGFWGNISDDYGIKELWVVIKKVDSYKESRALVYSFSKGITQREVKYILPDEIQNDNGYIIYFEVKDNDGINGSKTAKSKEFYFFKKDDSTLADDLLNQGDINIKDIGEKLKESSETKDKLDSYSEESLMKKDSDWKDKKRIKEILSAYDKQNTSLDQAIDKLESELEKNNSMSKDSESKENSRDILDRIKELKKLQKDKEILAELKDLQDKISKEKLTSKVNDLKKSGNIKKRSLERILEMAKRFYVEQKSKLLAEKVRHLAEDQQKLNESGIENKEFQEDIKDKFEQVKKDLDSLKKESEKLKKPISTYENKELSEKVSEDLKKASDSSSSSEGDNKKAAKSLKKMAKDMSDHNEESSQAMAEQVKLELRSIIQSNLSLSYGMEENIKGFEELDINKTNHGELLRNSKYLTNHFDNVKDSIYMLSSRLKKMQIDIDKYIDEVSVNMYLAIGNYSENEIAIGVNSERESFKNVNIINAILSNLMDQMNKSKKKGKGKGGEEETSLPDLIKEQGEKIEKLEEQLKNQQKEGEGEPKEGESGKDKQKGEGEPKEGGGDDLFKKYKELAELQEKLNEIGQNNKKTNELIDEAKRSLLFEGYNNEFLNKMRKIKAELMELDTANKKKEKFSKKRESKSSNKSGYNSTVQLELELQKKIDKEKIKRNKLPLNTIYKHKVDKYFESKND